MKEPPKIIYKYRNWIDDHHKRMLTMNELYLTSPKKFNDPFDCRIGQNFSLLSQKEADEYVTNLAISKYAEVEKQGSDLAVVIRNFERRFANKTEFQAKADSQLFDIQDHCYGIFSCSRRWNSILMWSHYSANHTGICIGFWWEKMMTLIDKNIIGKCGDVSYATNFPKIKPRIARLDNEVMKRAFIQTHTKAKEWEYEEEYRFMHNNPEGIPESKRTIKVPNNFFAEVILGVAIPNEYRDEIILICKEKGIPVYQAKKKKIKFEIKRQKVLI